MRDPAAWRTEFAGDDTERWVVLGVDVDMGYESRGEYLNDALMLSAGRGEVAVEGSWVPRACGPDELGVNSADAALDRRLLIAGPGSETEVVREGSTTAAPLGPIDRAISELLAVSSMPCDVFSLSGCLWASDRCVGCLVLGAWDGSGNMIVSDPTTTAMDEASSALVDDTAPFRLDKALSRTERASSGGLEVESEKAGFFVVTSISEVIGSYVKSGLLFDAIGAGA